jgi:uncharacterized protein involved in response to NO
MYSASSEGAAAKVMQSRVLASGFRPTFLAAAVAALLLVPAWVLIWGYGMPLPGGWPITLWHAHEMVFGFVAVAIAGFLLTAVPNWTGQRGFTGTPLLILMALWTAARVLIATAGAWLATAVLVLDVSFLVLLGILIAPPLLRSGNRNAVMLVVLALLAGCNATFHWALMHQNPPLALRTILIAIDIALLLVTIVGGRIVPAFTGNALRASGSPIRILAWPAIGPVAVGLMVTVIVVDLLRPDSRLAGILAAIVAVVQTARMLQWRSFAVLRSPIVWVLHLAYAWLPVGFALKAMALLFGLALSAFWLHALTVGVLATMVLAVMSRAALGHTGRPLVVEPAIALGYLLLLGAALVRVFGLGVLSMPYPAVILVSATCWTLAFGSFFYVYAPILWSARFDGKPG